MRRVSLVYSAMMITAFVVHEWLSARLVDEAIAGTLLAGGGSPTDAAKVLAVLGLRLSALIAVPIWIMLLAATFARPIRTRLRHSSAA